MANRSYLYGCDAVPGGDGFRAQGLSEYNWDLPLVHKLMLANQPRVVRSAIWPEHEIGVLGERAGAFERASTFFTKLAEGIVEDRKAFDEELADMKAFLAAAPPTRYLLLEAGEIFDILGGDLDAAARDLVTEIPAIAARVDRALAGQEDAWLGELRASWRDLASPGYWNNVLYFSLDG